MADTPMTHRYTGNHPAEINGVMREPGEFFTLTTEQAKDPHITEYLANGTLLDLKGGESKNG